MAGVRQFVVLGCGYRGSAVHVASAAELRVAAVAGGGGAEAAGVHHPRRAVPALTAARPRIHGLRSQGSRARFLPLSLAAEWPSGLEPWVAVLSSRV